MPPVSYLPRTWVDPRVQVRASAIHGQGFFTTGYVAAGDVLMIWGGTVYSVADLHAGRIPGSRSYSIIAPDVVLAGPNDDVDYFMNHSCDPTIWMTDAVTLVARCAIAPDEELCGDYALWESEPDYVLAPCACGSPFCRTRITGTDWKLPALQARYRGHFLPMLEHMIVAQQARIPERDV